MFDGGLDQLRTAMNPRSIAVIGASENPNKVGGRPLQFLKRFGFAGNVYPINPARAEVQGLASARSLADLPEAPEVAIIAVAGQAAFDGVEECATAGVKLAIVMAAGFGEIDPVHGKEMERRMTALAHARGMRIIGPNSQGLANFGTGAILSFSTMFAELPPPEDGPVGIVGQSGAVSASIYGILRHRGIGVRHVHATGNDCDVTTCELASVVAEDPDLKLLLMYLEGLPDPHHLARAATIARARDLPIVVVKGGRTQAGQTAASTHTGSLSSEDRVVDAFLRQHGIWRAGSIAEMIESTELYLKGWRPAGRKLVAITTSGATGVMVADAADTANLEMADFTPATSAALASVLPPIATAANPLDLTGALLTDNALFVRVLDVVAQDPGVDAFFAGITVAGAGYDVDMLATAAAQCAARTGKPVVIAAPQESVADRFRAAGLPSYQFETRAVEAMGRFMAHLELMRTTRLRAPAQPAPQRIAPHAGDARVRNEVDSLALLAEAGVPVVSHRLCRSADEVREAFAALGAPVVIKGCSSEVTHKSELGIVALNIRDGDQAVDTYHRIVDKLGTAGVAFEGVLVARMVNGRREMMLGAHRDPVFGPVIVLGDGGKYVEAMPDVRVLIAPVTPELVRDTLSRLRIAPLFAGVRGEPPMDMDAFVDAVMAVSHIMTAADSRIESIDINPLIVATAGGGCLAVDAVVVSGSN